MPACVDQELLLGGLVDGELDAANTALVEAHVVRCDACRNELERLQAVLAQYPLPEPALQSGPQVSGKAEGWCAIHQCQMKQTTKEGRSWWSHRVDGQWCKGR